MLEFIRPALQAIGLSVLTTSTSDVVTIPAAWKKVRKSLNLTWTGKSDSRSGAGDDGDLVLEAEAGGGHGVCQIVLNNEGETERTMQ